MLNDQQQERFTRLWTEAQPVVVGYVHSVVRDAAVAKDIVQETALALLRKFPEYDERQPFLPWALGMAKFEILGHRRDTARSRLTFDPELFERFTETWGDVVQNAPNETGALQTCLDRLAQHARRVVQLRYFEALNATEIAARTGTNAGTVRVLLQRAREQLRLCVERQLRAEGRLQ